MKSHNEHAITRLAIIFLQSIIVLIGVVTFTALLVGPQFEGRNTNATLFETYFTDPFLAYVYVASIPFFVALVQAFKGLGYISQDKVFSQAAVKTLRTIRYCAFIIAGSTLVADIYIRITALRSNDDPAGAIMLGIVFIFISVVVAAVTMVCEKTLQNAVDMNTEKDLTV